LQGSDRFGIAQFGHPLIEQDDPLPATQYHSAAAPRTPRTPCTEQSETTPIFLTSNKEERYLEESPIHSRGTSKKADAPLTVPSSSHYDPYQPPASSTSHVSVTIQIQDSHSHQDPAAVSSEEVLPSSFEGVHQYLSGETRDSSVSESQQLTSPMTSSSSQEAPCTCGIHPEVTDTLTSSKPSLDSYSPEVSQENLAATDTFPLYSSVAAVTATQVFSPAMTTGDASGLISSTGGRVVLPQHVPASSVPQTRPEGFVYTPAIQGTISHPSVYPSGGTVYDQRHPPVETVQHQQYSTPVVPQMQDQNMLRGASFNPQLQVYSVTEDMPRTMHEDPPVLGEGMAATSKARDHVVQEQGLPITSQVHTLPSVLSKDIPPARYEGTKTSEGGMAAFGKVEDPAVQERVLPCVSEPQQLPGHVTNRNEDFSSHRSPSPIRTEDPSHLSRSPVLDNSNVSRTSNRERSPFADPNLVNDERESFIGKHDETGRTLEDEKLPSGPLRRHKPQMESLDKATVGVVNIKPYSTESRDYPDMGIEDRTTGSFTDRVEEDYVKQVTAIGVQVKSDTNDKGTSTEVPIERYGLLL